jgi:hypothetical protein
LIPVVEMNCVVHGTLVKLLQRRTALSIACEGCLLLVFSEIDLWSPKLLSSSSGTTVGRQTSRSQEHVWLECGYDFHKTFFRTLHLDFKWLTCMYLKINNKDCKVSRFALEFFGGVVIANVNNFCQRVTCCQDVVVYSSILKHGVCELC